MSSIDESCEACSPDATALTKGSIVEFLELNGGWSLSLDVDFDQLIQTFRFKNFSEAQDFAVKVGDLAEWAGHHPSILTEYGRVTVRWWSHKIKGLHEQDLVLASKTESLYRKRTDAL